MIVVFQEATFQLINSNCGFGFGIAVDVEDEDEDDAIVNETIARQRERVGVRLSSFVELSE
jgi:hypothetical protein